MLSTLRRHLRHERRESSTGLAHTGDAIIIGAGPAGVSCAVWLRQLGFTPLLVDQNPVCGGLQLRNPYTNTWIATSANAWGKDVAAAMQANVVRHGVVAHLGRKALGAERSQSGFTVNLDKGASLTAPYLVLAGGSSPKDAGLVARAGLLLGPGPAVAETDFQNKRVAILGGGDSAFENYHVAIERGAKSVTIFARSIRARPEQLSRVPMSAVVLGEHTFEADSNLVNGQPYDQVLVLYGFSAHKSALLGLEIPLKPDGFVATAPNCETGMPGVYAVGELARRAHPCCVTAMADGVVAAKDIQQKLEVGTRQSYLNALKRAASLVGSGGS